MPTRPSQPPSDRTSGANSGIAEVPGALRGLAARWAALAGLVLFTAHASAAQDQSRRLLPDRRTTASSSAPRGSRSRSASTAGSTKRSTRPCLRSATSSRRSRRRARRRRNAPTRGCCTTTTTSTSCAAAGTRRRRSSGSPTRCAAIRSAAAPERQLRRDVRHVPRPAERRSSSTRTPLGALRRSGAHRRGQPEPRLESGLGRADRPIRRRMDGRDGDSVQVAPLHAGTERRPGGFRLRRGIRRKNEWTHLTALPPASGGSQGIFRISRPATLVGLELPPASRNIEIKPYAIARLDDRSAARACRLERRRRRLRRRRASTASRANLTADFTYNTDFAQVEVDEQQVNLTRFALIFPEKRDFFLEGRGIFDFGRGVALAAGRGGADSGDARRCSTAAASASTAAASSRSTSAAGMTGKVGDIRPRGCSNIQTGDERGLGHAGQPTSRSCASSATSCGAAASARSSRTVRNSVAARLEPGVSASTRRSRFFENVDVGRLLRATTDAGRSTRDDRQLPGTVRLRRRSVRRARRVPEGRRQLQPRGRPRPPRRLRALASARCDSARGRDRSSRCGSSAWEGSFENFENGAGQTRNARSASGRFNTEFENSDQFSVEASNNYELLVAPVPRSRRA